VTFGLAGRIDGPGPIRSAGCSLKGVEDQVEADLELVAVAVAGLEDVPEGQLGEVGVGIGGQLPGDLLRDLPRLLGGVERQARLLQREPVDVAVEQGVSVGGQPSPGSATTT